MSTLVHSHKAPALPVGASRYLTHAALVAAIRAAASVALEDWPADPFPASWRKRGPDTVGEFAGPLPHGAGPQWAPYARETRREWEGPIAPTMAPREDLRASFHYSIAGARGRMTVENRRSPLTAFADRIERAARAFADKAPRALSLRPAKASNIGSAPHVTARALYREGDYAGALQVAESLGAVYFAAPWQRKDPKTGAVIEAAPILYMRPDRIEREGLCLIVARAVHTGRFHVTEERCGCRVDTVRTAGHDKGFATGAAALAWLEGWLADESSRDMLRTAAAKASPISQTEERARCELAPIPADAEPADTGAEPSEPEAAREAPEAALEAPAAESAAHRSAEAPAALPGPAMAPSGPRNSDELSANPGAAADAMAREAAAIRPGAMHAGPDRPALRTPMQKAPVFVAPEPPPPPPTHSAPIPPATHSEPAALVAQFVERVETETAESWAAQAHAECELRRALAQSLADCAALPEFGGSVCFRHETDEKSTAIAGADMSGADAYRLTLIDGPGSPCGEGPSGHSGFRTLAEACDEALSRGYLPIDAEGLAPATHSEPGARLDAMAERADAIGNKRRAQVARELARAERRARQAAAGMHCGRVYPLAVFALGVRRHSVTLHRIEHTGAVVEFAAKWAGVAGSRSGTCTALEMRAAILRGERATARARARKAAAIRAERAARPAPLPTQSAPTPPATHSENPGALPWQILAARSSAFYATPIYRIGKHEWCMVVYLHDAYGACTDQLWRPVDSNRSAFRVSTEWPKYDGDRTNSGLPESIGTKVYNPNREAIAAALAEGRNRPDPGPDPRTMGDCVGRAVARAHSDPAALEREAAALDKEAPDCGRMLRASMRGAAEELRKLATAERERVAELRARHAAEDAADTAAGFPPATQSGGYFVMLDHEQSAGHAETIEEARKIGARVLSESPFACTVTLQTVNGEHVEDIGASRGKGAFALPEAPSLATQSEPAERLLPNGTNPGQESSAPDGYRFVSAYAGARSNGFTLASAEIQRKKLQAAALRNPGEDSRTLFRVGPYFSHHAPRGRFEVRRYVPITGQDRGRLTDAAPLPGQSEHTHERPCAAPGLTSYRARGAFGWIMIGAHDDADAMNEARRSTPTPTSLEVWTGTEYVPCADPPAAAISETENTLEILPAAEAFEVFEIPSMDAYDAAPGYWDALRESPAPASLPPADPDAERDAARVARGMGDAERTSIALAEEAERFLVGALVYRGMPAAEREAREIARALADAALVAYLREAEERDAAERAEAAAPSPLAALLAASDARMRQRSTETAPPIPAPPAPMPPAPLPPDTQSDPEPPPTHSEPPPAPPAPVAPPSRAAAAFARITGKATSARELASEAVRTFENAQAMAKARAPIAAEYKELAAMLARAAMEAAERENETAAEHSAGVIAADALARLMGGAKAQGAQL